MKRHEIYHDEHWNGKLMYILHQYTNKHTDKQITEGNT